MKKLLLATTAIAVMMGSVSSAASSSLAYETRLAQKETLEAAGKKYYGDVAGDGWSTCISGLCFIGEDTLTPGTLKPAVTNARDLLLASKAVGSDVLVASADNSFVFVKSPFIEELAEQNSVSYEYMASLLWDHSIDTPTNADGEVITWQEAMQAETVKIAAMADILSNGEAGFDYEGGYAELQSVIEMLEADAVGNAVAIEALNTKIAELEANADINAASIVSLNSDVSHWKAEAKKYNDGFTAATQSAAIKVKQDEIDTINAELKQAGYTIAQKQQEINILKLKVDNKQETIVKLQDSIEETRIRHAEAIQAEVDLRAEKISELITDVDNLERKLETANELSAFYKMRAEDLGAELKAEQAAHKTLSEEFQTLAADRDNLRDVTIPGLEAHIDDLDKEISAHAEALVDSFDNGYDEGYDDGEASVTINHPFIVKDSEGRDVIRVTATNGAWTNIYLYDYTDKAYTKGKDAEFARWINDVLPAIYTAIADKAGVSVDSLPKDFNEKIQAVYDAGANSIINNDPLYDNEDDVHVEHVTQAFKDGVSTVRANVDKIAEKYGVATGNAAGVTANALYTAGFEAGKLSILSDIAIGGFEALVDIKVQKGASHQSFNSDNSTISQIAFVENEMTGFDTFSFDELYDTLQTALDTAYDDGYNDGYTDGFRDGYAAGHADASITQ